MWKKTKEMKWKTAKLLWGDLFYDIAGAAFEGAFGYIRLRETPILLPAELREYLYC